MASHNKQVKRAFKRYKVILAMLAEKKDERGINLLEGLVNACRKYMGHVAKTEAYARKVTKGIPGLQMDLSEQKALDKLRTNYHNKVIDFLKTLNSHLFKEYSSKLPRGGIYTLDPTSIENRGYVAEWVGYLVEGLAKNK